MDYHASDKNTFTAEFNFLRWWSPNGIQTGLDSTTGAGITGNGDDSVRVRNGKLGWTWVPTSTFVNTFRFGGDTDRQADGYDQAELGSGSGLSGCFRRWRSAWRSHLPAARGTLRNPLRIRR